MPTEETIINLGALIDTRLPEVKEKDHSIVELITSAAPVIWVEKKESQWRKFRDQNQSISTSCVANTARKMNQVNMSLKYPILLDFSENSIFDFRSNKPGEGMIGMDCFDIWHNRGMTLEAFMPGQNMSDAEMDAVPLDEFGKQVGLNFRISGHADLPKQNIEIIASTIQATGKAVMVWYYFNGAEWSLLIPNVQDTSLDLYAPETLRHSVTAVDFFLYKVNGRLQKCLLIEDSAHFGGKTRRIITEDFHKSRNWFAHWATTYKYIDATDPEPSPIPLPEKPHHTFSVDLEFIPLDDLGEISDIPKNERQKADTIALQNILKYEGFFPANQASSGYYGAVTRRAVRKFQEKYGIATPAEIAALDGKRVGPATRAKLNQIYG